MKKRRLRKPIQNIMLAVSIALTMFLAMLQDFEVRAIPMLLGMLAVLIINLYVLKKYGKVEL